jgi:hypothetical protein
MTKERKTNTQEDVIGFDYEKQTDNRNRKRLAGKAYNLKEEKRVNFIKEKKAIQREEQAEKPLPEKIKIVNSY